MGSCTSLQIGPLDRSSPLNFHVLFMVSLIKNYFPYFHQKMWKIALHPTGILKSYKYGTVEDTYKLFAPNGGFGVGQFNGVI